MAITKPKPKTQATIDSFISGAPDSETKPGGGVKKGNKLQISLTIAPTKLDKVDELAAKLGYSRATIINMGINLILDEYGL